MNEVTRRYLRQQIEIGGAEMVLDTLPARRPTPPESPAATPPRAVAHEPVEPDPPGPPAAAPSTPPPESAKKAKGGDGGKRDWRTGAPPIPGPGVTIEPPPADLLGGGPAWSSLEEVATVVAGCTKCFLAKGRTHTVPGEGSPRARLMLVGEGPGQTEDETGRPFVGRAGQLLEGMLAAIGLSREQVFIANVVKCRPPQNRKPLPDEMAACLPYLHAQIELIGPKVILALGATAAEGLLQVKRSLGDLRGKVHSYRGVALVVTYHPAALLRNPNWKKPAWDDIRIARQLVDR